VPKKELNDARPQRRRSSPQQGVASLGRPSFFEKTCACFPQGFPLVSPRPYRAVQPDAEQTIRAGGSPPRLTIASTGPRPCVLKADRVSLATEPFASWFMAAR
jgi:hypothetical protein